MNNIKQLLAIAEKKIEIDQNGTWSKGSITYYKAMFDELEEVKEEMDSNRKCYLEDELGDILWVYMCLLKNLEAEGTILTERVFERALKKYKERLDGINDGVGWTEIKKRQKETLTLEYLTEMEN
ncbi:nucleotide pyrophosphohydrolase [Shewanella sp. Choline-02u-19]|uniref:MazG nucleotide pyrophosphohydrolase domain-containing protein n=1 Tax=unclassified Shewanella TaxID=196818 RepID=UPI000C341F8C|nr:MULTISPECIES: MazG nucleotide pyrophosphohydrolase domain-containing protein [unclassified Shewanella]PKH59328.1 nucleotide pyrophosphohydrolase [Shewanella sp. Bg11-22]PKI29161.1 nucleotide pyrophosphohydrolase [Shewanella sp. Choline-02u-19]